MRSLFVALLILLASSSVLAAESKVKIAVLDLQANGVDKSLAAGATSLVASELQKLDVFRVVSREDIRSMLQFEKDKQVLGCDADQACLAEIGGALGVDYTVAGSLAKVGDAFLLSLVLSSTKTAQVENRVSETVAKQEQIVAAVARDAQMVVSKILKGREGWLVLTSSEAGASVKIDGQIRGSTPLPGRLALSWGPHLLEVEKVGFVTSSEDISIPNKQVLARSVALVPSSDFIGAYDSSARKMRLGAWIATGTVVAAGGLAILFNQLSASTESKFQGERTQYVNNTGAVTLAQLNSLSQKGSNEVLGARVALGTAVVAAGFATWFWIAGDDPHRYDGYREQGPVAATARDAAPSAAIAFSAAPVPHGATVGLLGLF